MVVEPFSKIEEVVAASDVAVFFATLNDTVEGELEPAGAMPAGGTCEETAEAVTQHSSAASSAKIEPKVSCAAACDIHGLDALFELLLCLD